MGGIESKRAWRVVVSSCALTAMVWGASGGNREARANDRNGAVSPLQSATPTGDGDSPAPSGSPAPPSSAPATPARPRLDSPTWVNAQTLVIPPTDTSSPRPLVMMLHGMCDAPQNECGYFHQGAKDAGYLVCPRANVSCGGGGYQWTAAPKVLDPLLASSIAATAEAVDLDLKGDNVIVGFSQGASRAVDAATRSEVHFVGLVLIAAVFTPDVAKLKAAGVHRVWLTSGDFDSSRKSMIKATKLLNDGGIEAKFTSLGQIGHTFASDMPARMAEAISWVRAPSP